MRERRADYTTPVGASSRVRQALRHLHRMAEPAAYMFDQPLSALSDLGVGPGTAASGSAAPRSLSAFSSPTPLRSLPACNEDALNNVSGSHAAEPATAKDTSA